MHKQMHSSWMHTVRCSGRLGRDGGGLVVGGVCLPRGRLPREFVCQGVSARGVHPPPDQRQTPPGPETDTPWGPEVDTPLPPLGPEAETPKTRGRHPAAQSMLGYTPLPRGQNS